MIRHTLDEEDDKLMARWKGNGLNVYTALIKDDEREVVFNAYGFELRVPAAMYGVPMFTQDHRDILTMFLDELEAAPQVVRL